MIRPSRSRARQAAVAVALALVMLGPAAALPFPSLPSPPTQVNASVPFTPAATIYTEDFEFSDGGYVAGGSASWQHGSVVSPPTPVVGQGPGMWGTNVAGDYGNSECGFVQSAPIDLSAYVPAPETGVSAARLAFRHWMSFESRYDAGLVMASSDGEAWRIITPVGGYGLVPFTSARACFGTDATVRAFTTSSTVPAEDAWQLAEFDVSAFMGGDLHVRWVFASDASVVRRGWYVDDVVLQVGAGAAASVPLPTVVGETGLPFTPVATLYAEDFEGTDGGWTADGTMAWEWGAAIAPPVTFEGSLNVWGTRIHGDYLSNECSSLTSPVISIPGADAGADVEAARLAFSMWQHLENGFDAAHVQASTDGGATWFRITPEGDYDRTITSSSAAGTRACLGVSTGDRVWSGPSLAPKEDAWEEVTFDLTSLMGQDVQFRITMASDGDTERRGVYIDDVIVQVGAGVVMNVQPDFSGGLVLPMAPGWTVTGTNPSWQYGIPGETPASARPVFGTNLGGNYNANECSAVESRTIDTNAVPGLGRLTLTFEHSFHTYSSLDGGVVQVSNDGGATWRTVTPVGGYNGNLGTNARACLAPGATTAAGFINDATGADWDSRSVVLSSYQGETIRIRFAFGSSASGHDTGWSIRNIAVNRGAGNVPLAASALAPIPADVMEKLDPALRREVQRGGADTFRVIVSGQPHEGVAEQDFATREDAVAWFDAKAAPFIDGVTSLVGLRGGDVRAAWALVPAVSVQVDLPTLVTLGQRSDVHMLTADKDDSVRLIAPEVPADGSFETTNTEGRAMIQAEDIWALGFRGEGVKLAIIDTGIDGAHEAFKNADGSSRIVAWRDWVNGRATPYDDQGHGTHVAGTAAGSDLYEDPTFGRFTQVGVAPRAELMGVKFLDSRGSGSFENAVNSINWAFSNGADITSNSWGASGCSSAAYPVMAAVRTTTDAGMLSVFAAGNSGPGSGTIGSPACSESALTIGATDKNGVIASFSSRGPCSDNEIGGAPRICPDVVAKGYLVLSSAPRGTCSLCNSGGYKVLNGTSMATPHASGAAVLAEQMKRFYTGSGWDTAGRAEEQVFKLTSLDLGAAGEDNTYGWGLPQLLNIYAMLDATDEARIVSSFLISDDVIRQGDSTLLKFSVRNLGGAIATGVFQATLTDPEGTTSVLKTSTPSLGILDGESYSQTFVVSGSVLPGTYTFAGTFDYSWTDGDGNTVVGVAAHSGTFDVKRVFMDVQMDGLDASTMPGDLQVVTYTATNTGNEPASNVTIEFTVPDKYVFVPGAGFDPSNPNSRYASPAPSKVVEDKNFGRVTLVFQVGDVAEGDSFSFTTQMLPTLPGSYRFLSVAKWQDGGGNKFAQGALHAQTVGAP